MGSDQTREREAMAEKILEHAPRLSENDRFVFGCYPGVSCFNACCGNVNIVLTPLDILRMARRLKTTTSDFLSRHTFVPFNGEAKLPFVFLKMTDDDRKSCPFVTEHGCSIYEDRPWPCRMYPLGEASPGADNPDPGFYFLIHEPHCQGHGEKKEWTVAEWVGDQGIAQYREMGELWKTILLHPYLKTMPLDPARMEMFYMASYDLDKFREFVFRSRFLGRFKLEDGIEEMLRSDDMVLMRFAVRWLRFALFGEATLEIRPELLSEREREMLKNRR